ncbi:thymidylate synthase [Pseudomonas phage Lu11]|uniref:thymidylate synthase n=1 Tax=Pseudomonas phage Lu11 TaxID=1161927 RepID=UPI00025F180B|nr:thymidylate synthase [Pseudomonas phage Lu11]AFH14760.1 thymidylate synthase [Pseudomonas phage Lu11]
MFYAGLVRSSEDRVFYEDNTFDFEFRGVLKHILDHGEVRNDRTKTGTISVFGSVNYSLDLRDGFPAITAKILRFVTMKKETIKWMLEGKSDLKTLKDINVNIWDQNVKPGTEVYEGRKLHAKERMLLGTSGQRMKARQFLRDIGVPSTVNENALPENIEAGVGFILDTDKATEEQWAQLDLQLNNWGIPERALSGGDLGPIYGKQWREWDDIRIIDSADWRADPDGWAAKGYSVIGKMFNGWEIAIGRKVDQIAAVEEAIKNEIRFHNGEIEKHSAGRRIILTGWNVAQLDEMSLPPCHTLAQWYVSSNKNGNGKYYLDCKLYMRSNDMFLGAPFNVAQYAMLTEMLAHAHDLQARNMHITIGDAHIYSNHVEQVREQLSRPIIYKSPKLEIKSGPVNSILDIQLEDVNLVGYESYETIKAPIAGN